MASVLWLPGPCLLPAAWYDSCRWKCIGAADGSRSSRSLRPCSASAPVAVCSGSDLPSWLTVGTLEQAEKLRRQRATASMLDKGYSHWTYGAKPLEADPAAAPLPPHGPAPVPPPARSIPPIKSAHTARLPTPRVRAHFPRHRSVLALVLVATSRSSTVWRSITTSTADVACAVAVLGRPPALRAFASTPPAPTSPAHPEPQSAAHPAASSDRWTAFPQPPPCRVGSRACLGSLPSRRSAGGLRRRWGGVGG